MFAHTVTIGRNIGDKPMDRETWEHFQKAVLNTLKYAFSPRQIEWHEIHFGRGEWNGVREDSAKITLFTSVPFPEDLRKSFLKETPFFGALSTYARIYGQDAVAFTTGKSTLIRK